MQDLQDTEVAWRHLQQSYLHEGNLAQLQDHRTHEAFADHLGSEARLSRTGSGSRLTEKSTFIREVLFFWRCGIITTRKVTTMATKLEQIKARLELRKDFLKKEIIRVRREESDVRICNRKVGVLISRAAEIDHTLQIISDVEEGK